MGWVFFFGGEPGACFVADWRDLLLYWAPQGEIQYAQRVNDIKILKRKINSLRRELHILKSSVSSIDKLKKEVVQLQKELREERARVRALSGLCVLQWAVELGE